MCHCQYPVKRFKGIRSQIIAEFLQLQPHNQNVNLQIDIDIILCFNCNQFSPEEAEACITGLI